MPVLRPFKVIALRELLENSLPSLGGFGTAKALQPPSLRGGFRYRSLSHI